MAKKPNGSAHAQSWLTSGEASSFANRLGPCLEEINPIAACVVEGVVGPSSDANHAAFGHRLLLVLFTTEVFDVGVDGASGELKAKLLSAAGIATDLV